MVKRLCYSLVLLLASALAQATPLQHIDQSNTSLDNYQTLPAASGTQNSLKQTFIADYSRINFIELNIGVQERQSIQVQIYQGAQLLASQWADTYLPNCAKDLLGQIQCPTGNVQGGAVKVTFQNPVDLAPGQTYSLQVNFNQPLKLGITANTYTAGQFWLNNQLQSGDLWFRTGFNQNPALETANQYAISGTIASVTPHFGQ